MSRRLRLLRGPGLLLSAALLVLLLIPLLLLLVPLLVLIVLLLNLITALLILNLLVLIPLLILLNLIVPLLILLLLLDLAVPLLVLLLLDLAVPLLILIILLSLPRAAGRTTLHPAVLSTAHGSGDSRSAGMPAVVLEIETPVRPGGVLMLHLGLRSAHVPIMIGHPFLRPWLVLNTATSAAERHMIVVDDGRIVDNRPVFIHVVVEAASVHVHDGGVVEEIVAAPHAAGKTDAHVAEAVIHAAVVAHMIAPVAGMPHI